MAAAGQVYLLLDGAAGHRLLADLSEAGASVASLFPDNADEELLDAAPRLVNSSDITDILHRFPDFWGRSIVSIVVSTAPRDELLSHLKRCLYVEDPDGEVCILRYYDPRVLVRMSELLHPEQEQALFSDVVDSFLFEDDIGDVRKWNNPQKDTG